MSSHDRIILNASNDLLNTEEGKALLAFQEEHNLLTSLANLIYEHGKEIERREENNEYAAARSLFADAFSYAGGIKQYRKYTQFIDMAVALIGDAPFTPKQ